MKQRFLEIGIITTLKKMNKENFLTGKTILITGGTGFIGSHLLDEIVLSNPRKVYVVDDLSSSSTSNVEQHVNDKNSVVSFIFSTILNKELIYDLVNQSSVIIHLAASNVGLSLVDPHKNSFVNVCGTINILEAMKSAGGNKTLLHVSSGSVVNPFTPYAISKKAGEEMALFYGKERGLKVAVVRPHHVYGPRQDCFGKSGVINIFLRSVITEGFMNVWGDGNQVKNFTNVKDVVFGILTVCEKLNNGDEVNSLVFDIASDRKMTINDLAQNIKELFKKDGEGVFVDIRHTEEKVGENKELFPDVSNLKSLGWKETVSFNDGLLECFKYVRNKINKIYVPRNKDRYNSSDLQ